MAFDMQKFETSAEHFGQAATSALKFIIHFAAAAAPIAASVASATGHKDVVGDINKAGEAANTANSVMDQLNVQ